MPEMPDMRSVAVPRVLQIPLMSDVDVVNTRDEALLQEAWHELAFPKRPQAKERTATPGLVAQKRSGANAHVTKAAEVMIRHLPSSVCD